MKVIHCITRKLTQTEKKNLGENSQMDTPISEDDQKKMIKDHLETKMGFKLKKDKQGRWRTNPDTGYELSWKVHRSGSNNIKFGETRLGVWLFKMGGEGRNTKFEKGDIIIVPSFSTIFGDHPRHNMEIIGNVIGYYQGRFIITDIGELKDTNKEGKILFLVLKTLCDIRFESRSESQLKKKRELRRGNKFQGGKRPKFGTTWKSVSDPSLLQLSKKDEKNLKEKSYGKYYSVKGDLVPNKMEKESIKMMRKLRKQGLSYMKISKTIKDHFENPKGSGNYLVKISHQSVWRILNNKT